MNTFNARLCGCAVKGCAAIFTALFATSPAWAINSNGLFEVDGNATEESAAGDDWEKTVDPNYSGAAKARVFVPDEVPPLSPTELVFTGGGSKDDLDLGQWKHKPDTDTTPSKDNITNAYAAAYAWDHDSSSATPPHLVIYFGADRFAQNGDANIGFWFFRNPVFANPSTGRFDDGSGNPAQHAVGDVAVQVDFLNGGATTRVRVFKWVGSGGSHGTLDLLKSATSSGAAVCTPDDAACAVTNLTSNIQAYWPYKSKFAPSPANGITGDNVIPPQGFFEGGVDMTALGLTGCFSSFMANTRSSQQVDAVLKDFALGSFSTCGIKVGKACLIEEGTSPKVNDNGKTVHTKFSVPIENFGFGPVFDVTLRENIGYDTAFSITESCKVTKIGATGVDLALPGGTPGSAVNITSELAAGTTLGVTVECDTFDNPLVNKVIAEAKSSDVLSAPDLAAAHITNTDPNKGVVETCSAAVSPTISVIKSCRPVTLVGVTPEVCVDITVKNTGKEDLVGVQIGDDKIGTLVTDGTLESNDNAAGGPDEVKFEKQCYTPTATDGDDVNPGSATFTDRVDVSGTGFISRQEVTSFATATCKLCPGDSCPAQ